MTTSSPAGLIHRTRELVARRRRRRVAVTALAAVPVVGLSLVLVDASAALPTWARAVVLLMSVVSLIGVTVGVLALWRLLRPGESRARTIAEQALADRHRHLTTAMELSAMSGPLAAQAASQFAADLDTRRLESGLAPVRVRRAVVVACVALVLTGAIQLVWPSVLPSVLPRLYDPFGDHPPWSRTSLTLIDPPSRVRPPVTPRLVVGTEGPQPKGLELHVEDAAGTPVARMAMLAIGGDQWAAHVGPLTAEHVTTLVSPLRVWVSGAGTRTRYHRLAIDPVPSLLGGTLAHVSPGYARLPDAVVKLSATPPEIHALPGSSLTVQALANRPLRAVELFRDGQSAGREPGLSLTLADPAVGAWSVVLEAEDGIRSEALPLCIITRRNDEPPLVRYEQPQSDGVATPDMYIPLVVHAQDDLGLVRLTRYRLRNDQRETEGRDALGGTGDTWRGRLSTAGTRPGDVIRMGAVATDTLPPDGQVSAPVERRIHIISHADYNALVMEQIDEHALEQKYGDLLSRIGELEQQLADASKAPASPARSEKLDQLAERAAQLRQQVAELRRPDPLFAIEPQLQDRLERHLQALEQHAKEAKQRTPSDPSPQAAEQLRKELAAMTAQAEADALREHLRDLATAQRQAADELAELKQHGIRNDADRARLRETSRGQQEMEQALKDWQEAVKDTTKRLAESRPEAAQELQQLAAQVAQCDAERLVAQAGRAGRVGKVGDAHGDAEEAARRLAGLAGAGPGEGQRGKDAGQPGWCPGDGYGQCLSQLAGLAKRGFNPGSSQAAGGGGATGARGGGMMVRRGGRSTPNGEPLQLFGPEALSALSGATSGQQKSGTPANAAAAGDADQARAATAYATGTRATTAGVGASFSPGEQVLIEDYFRRLDGDPTAPAGPEAPDAPRPPQVAPGNSPP